MRLRTRLFVTHVTLSALAVVLMGGVALTSFRRFFLDSTRADLAARTTALAALTTDWFERDNLARVQRIVERHGAQADLTLRVFGPDGALIATSAPATDARVRDWRAVPGVAAALAGQPAAGIARGIGTADDRLYDARPLVRNGRLFGAMRVSRTLAAFNQQVSRSIVAIVAAVVAALAMATLVSARLARALSAPIREMRDFAVAVGGGRLGAALASARRDELGELAAELNAMSARLAALDRERQTFLANASHELRTPVTNVHSTLEALENGAVEDPTLRAQFLETALAETRRMTKLIEALLDLGQLEANAVTLERRAVDVGELVARTTRPLAARFDAAGVALRVEGDAAWTEGDPDRLQRALFNVLDNALHHSARDGAVVVVVASEPEAVRIEVRDQGPGFAPADLPHVFEQFYSARRGGQGGARGTGLGLAIARRIVEAHGGAITAGNAPGGKGATVTLRLPRATGSPAVAARQHERGASEPGGASTA